MLKSKMFVKKIGKLSFLNTQLNCQMNNNSKMLTERINKSSLLCNKSFSVKHRWGNWLWVYRISLQVFRPFYLILFCASFFSRSWCTVLPYCSSWNINATGVYGVEMPATWLLIRTASDWNKWLVLKVSVKEKCVLWAELFHYLVAKREGFYLFILNLNT